MAKFVSLPDLHWVGGDFPWQLQSALVWESDALGTIRVPSGYRTDLASVPRLPIIHALAGGRAHMPAVLHDFLYEHHNTLRITRKQADVAFLQAMIAVDEPANAFTRYAMYFGVRMGGWFVWRRHKPHADDRIRSHERDE